MESKDVAEAVRHAEERIRPYIRETYLEASPCFSEAFGAEVYLKLENLQHTGSFKVRGALNKILSMPPEQQARGVVAASTGNHGAAVAFACNQVGARGLVFVPENASPGKVEAVRRLGAEVQTHGPDCADTEVFARHYAEEHSLVYISPYNDPEVVAGQGTLGVELARQLDNIDAVVVALGGGGLISGVAGYLKSVRSEVRIIGCSPENSAVMIESVRAGQILELESLPTLSDGTAGGVESSTITFDLCRDLVDDYVTVSEEAIVENLRAFMQTHHMMIEGSAAVALAGLRQMADRLAGKKVVVILCGANISLDVLKTIC
ncbi:MAG TPA: threonine/serine dehydratase [Rhodothermales bacterium]|nr:threonine/serine dehydratase [Rhodothermales bacterium]